MNLVMAMVHVSELARTPRERLVKDLVVTSGPAISIKVPLGIILATAATRMKVSSMMGVVGMRRKLGNRPADVHGQSTKFCKINMHITTI